MCESKVNRNGNRRSHECWRISSEIEPIIISILPGCSIDSVGYTCWTQDIAVTICGWMWTARPSSFISWKFSVVTICGWMWTASYQSKWTEKLNGRNNLRMDVNCKNPLDQLDCRFRCNNLRMDVNCKYIQRESKIKELRNNLRMDENRRQNKNL